MITPSSALENLVASLSAQEKRYIRLYLGRHEKSGKELLQVYDTVLNQAPENVPGKKKKEVRQKNSTQRSYLYRIMLKALRFYHEERTVDISLYERLINSALLYEKRLYELSLREIDFAYELACSNDRWPIAINILSFKADVVIEKNSKDIAQELATVHLAAKKMLGQLDELMELKSIQLRTYALCRIKYYQRSPEMENEIGQLLSSLHSLKPQRDSLLGHHYYLMTLAGHSYFRGEYDKAFSLYQELFQHWDRHPERIEAESLTYTRFLSNVMSAAHASGRFDIIPLVLEKLSSLVVHSAEEEAEQFQNIKYMELLHLMNTDGYDRLEKLTREISNGLNKYKTKVNKARELAFYHNLSMAWFLVHEWKQAIEWNDRIINQPRTEHRLDLQYAARLFRLILWFETGKQDLLDYELVNVERFLRSHKVWFAYESAVVKFFRKLLHVNAAETNMLLQNFQEHLETITLGKTSAALPCCSELRFWIKSKLSGEKMRELIKA